MKLKTPMLLALGLWLFSGPAAAGEDLEALVRKLMAEVAELKSRARQSDDRIRELEKQVAAQPPARTAASRPMETTPPPIVKPDTRPAVTVGDVKGSYKIPGTNTSVGIGGYVKLDAIYNSAGAKGGSNNYSNLMLIPPAIPVGGNLGNHGQTVFSARESRFWLKSFTPTAWGDLNAYLEMDFMSFQQPGIPVPGDERVTNGYAPRLRHAYGSLGNLLAGQTWTTFMNVAALPELNDFGGPVGQVFVRQALIRWTQPLPETGLPLAFQVALENPESTFTLPDGLRIAPDTDRAPDMVARLDYHPSWGALSAAGLARQIRYSSNARHEASDRWGGALSLAGRIPTFGLDTVRFMFSFGNALGRYASYNLFNDGALNDAGQIGLTRAYGGFLAYQHWWNPAWRSTLVYGYAHADNPAFVADSVSRQAQSVHVNLLWSPLLQATIGLEYLYAERERVDGQRGDLQRVQFSTRFNF